MQWKLDANWCGVLFSLSHSNPYQLSDVILRWECGKNSIPHNSFPLHCTCASPKPRKMSGRLFWTEYLSNQRTFQTIYWICLKNFSTQATSVRWDMAWMIYENSFPHNVWFPISMPPQCSVTIHSSFVFKMMLILGSIKCASKIWKNYHRKCSQCPSLIRVYLQPFPFDGFSNLFQLAIQGTSPGFRAGHAAVNIGSKARTPIRRNESVDSVECISKRIFFPVFWLPCRSM